MQHPQYGIDAPELVRFFLYRWRSCASGLSCGFALISIWADSANYNQRAIWHRSYLSTWDGLLDDLLQ